MSLLIQEDWVDATKGLRLGSSGKYEAFTDNIGKLFLYLSKEYGRCTSKIYIDVPDGIKKPIGWAFQKRKQYDDCKESFILETWVTLFEKSDDVAITRHYHFLK